MTRKTACFFCKTNNLGDFRRTEFLSYDVQMLEDLGFDVHIATKLSQLRPADLYFVWWWTWAFFPVVYASLLRRPSLITGVFNTWMYGERNWMHRAMHRFAVRHADANVFVSRFELDETTRLLPINNPHFSACAVDTNVYRPAECPESSTILTIAKMITPSGSKRKCIPEIIKSAPIVHREHPEARFVIAGEHGPYFANLARLVQDLGASEYVELRGSIAKDVKISLMQECALYLQPSRYEGFGLAVLEAMSCGMPVVTSPVGAVPHTVGDTALLVDGTSPESIAQSVIRLLDDPALRRDLGRQARLRAETVFPYERRTLDLDIIIEGILKNPQHSSSLPRY